MNNARDEVAGYAAHYRNKFTLWNRIAAVCPLICLPATIAYMRTGEDSWGAIVSGSLAYLSAFIWLVASGIAMEQKASLWRLIDRLLDDRA